MPNMNYWRSFQDDKNNFIFVFDVRFFILHVTVQAVSQIFLFQKPSHEFSEHFGKHCFTVHIHREGLWTCEVFFLVDDVLDEFFLICTEIFTNVSQLFAIELLLNHFDCFLADVEAHILGCNAFGLNFFVFLTLIYGRRSRNLFSEESSLFLMEVVCFGSEEVGLIEGLHIWRGWERVGPEGFDVGLFGKLICEDPHQLGRFVFVVFSWFLLVEEINIEEVVVLLAKGLTLLFVENIKVIMRLCHGSTYFHYIVFKGSIYYVKELYLNSAIWSFLIRHFFYIFLFFYI